MIIEIRKVGPTKYGNYAVFNAVFDNGYVVSGIANYKDFELKPDTTYKDLYVRQYQRNGLIRYSLFKK